jgi:hypothetical protein
MTNQEIIPNCTTHKYCEDSECRKVIKRPFRYCYDHHMEQKEKQKQKEKPTLCELCGRKLIALRKLRHNSHGVYSDWDDRKVHLKCYKEYHKISELNPELVLNFEHGTTI